MAHITFCIGLVLPGWVFQVDRIGKEEDKFRRRLQGEITKRRSSRFSDQEDEQGVFGTKWYTDTQGTSNTLEYF